MSQKKLQKKKYKKSIKLGENTCQCFNCTISGEWEFCQWSRGQILQNNFWEVVS